MSAERGRSEASALPHATEGLPEATRPELVELADGDELSLEIAPVRKTIGDATVRMLAYNGSIPGPTLKLPQGATATVHVTNHGDFEATVHWHGLRLENRFDGTHDTQAAIPVGEAFTYRVHVPDPGALLVPPAHPRGLRPGAGPVRQHPRRSERPRLLAAGEPRGAADAGRHPRRGRTRRALQPFRSEPRRNGALRQRHARLGRSRPHARRETGRVVRVYLTNTANTRCSTSPSRARR